MFLRRNRRFVDGETYEYWTLVKTVRTAKGPRQQVVATLGKEPGLESCRRRGWEEVAAMLEGHGLRPVQGQLGEPIEERPRRQWAQVDLSGVRVERVRDFGQVYLALALWRRLGLHRLLGELIEPGKEEVAWELIACILTLARFCGQKSELEVAQRWYTDSALEDLLGVSFAHINDARLYRGLDVLHAHKDKLCAHLLERYRSWFGVEFEFLLYDVTSTYFEGQALRNKKAARGYSRDQRPDCKQVNIGLVVTPEGLPVGYEVFAGNTADVATVEDMVTMMETKYGQAKRIWVLDRGMISEDNIDFLRQRGARYLVGTPKAQLRKLEAQLLDRKDWTQVQEGVEAKLVVHPDGGPGEQYLLCRSDARRQKEAAMIELQRLRLRPVFHQKTERVEAHILVCFLSLALWRVLEQWMRGKGLGNCARQLLKEVSTVRSLDVVLPIRPSANDPVREIRLRIVSRPDPPVAELLARLGLDLPNAPKIVQNVVDKNGISTAQPIENQGNGFRS